MVLGRSVLLKQPKQNAEINQFNENSSLFVYSLNLLRESDDNLLKILKRVHINGALAESNNDYYLTEFSFKNTIESIIQFFIKTIEQIFGKFKSIFQKIVYSDNTIKTYENKLRNMSGEFNLNFERFNYTCFDVDIPSINLKSQFSLDYDDLLGKLADIRNLSTKEERIVRMNMIEGDVAYDVNNPAYFDKVRQVTLNTSYMISEHDYATELFNRFRDGGRPANNKINSTELSFILDRYLNAKSMQKKVETSKKETIDAAESIRKKIRGLSLQGLNSSYVPYDVDEEVIFNKILQHKTSQVNDTCNIFIMAFSAKLDAIKESMKQDKKILFEAIKFINIGGGD